MPQLAPLLDAPTLIGALRFHSDPASIVDAAKVARPWRVDQREWPPAENQHRYSLGGHSIGMVYKPKSAQPTAVGWRAFILGGWVEGQEKSEAAASDRVDALLVLDGWLLQFESGNVLAVSTGVINEAEPAEAASPLAEVADASELASPAHNAALGFPSA